MKKTAVPTPRILESTRSRKWSVAGALGELIDNSFGEERGDASQVTINWNRKKRTMSILDNGRGMVHVSDLFTLGEGTRTRGGRDIGRYGVGGSEALLWLASGVGVITLRDGMTASATVNWDQCIKKLVYPEIDDSWSPATVSNTPTELLEAEHGTWIYLKFRTGVRFHADAVQNQLSQTFSVGLRSSKRIRWIEDGLDTPLHAWNPGKLENVVTGEVTVREGLTARVRAGKVENLPVSHSKLSVNYLYRRIEETTDGFGRPLRGAVGSIDLSPGWRDYLTTTKDGFNDDGLREELMAEVQELLAPLIDALEEERMHAVFNNVKINLQRRIGGAFKTDLAEDEDPEIPDPGSNPEPHPNPVPKPRKNPGASIIDITQESDESLGGRLCLVQVSADMIQAAVNKDHHVVREALRKEPVNQRLLEQILISHLAAELFREGKLVEVGLYSRRGYAELLDACGGDEMYAMGEVMKDLTNGVMRAEDPEPQEVSR